MKMDVSSESLQAYHELKASGQLGDEQSFVYEKLARYGPATGRELYRKIAADEVREIIRKQQLSKSGYNTEELLQNTTIDKGPERVRKRLPELADLGLVERAATRQCQVTNRDATVWQVKENA